MLVYFGIYNLWGFIENCKDFFLGLEFSRIFFIIIIITYFISQKEICLGSMIVKSIGMIFNTPGIKKKFQRKLYDSGEKCEYTYAIMKINQRYGMS